MSLEIGNSVVRVSERPILIVYHCEVVTLHLGQFSFLPFLCKNTSEMIVSSTLGLDSETLRNRKTTCRDRHSPVQRK